MKQKCNRRAFLRAAGWSGSGLILLANSRMAFAADANDKLNLVAIGIGGQGRSNLDNFAGLGVNVVALCDVDQAYGRDTWTKFPQAKPYRDFRRMFDEMSSQIDAVLVATPDHTHAVAAAMAMNLGKHVYCEKPLTRTVKEARVLRETALRQKVVTQMGNQGSASGQLRRAVELVWGGVIGEVREAHVWFDGGNGPQSRPQETPPVPSTLDWDLWLGPAPERPYHPCYLPGKWRAWRAFGSGIVGDFGCHTGNIMFRALQLDRLWQTPQRGAPERPVVIKFRSQPSEVDPEGYPRSSRTVMELPARGDLPSVTLTIYAKERPNQDLMRGYPQAGWGDFLVGSKGSLYSECPWNTRFVLLPEEKFDGFKGGPPETLPRIDSHHREWVNACKGRGKTFSGFEIGGPLTELMQLANLATQIEGSLEYDIVSGRILNSDRAHQLLHRDYRPGWIL